MSLPSSLLAYQPQLDFMEMAMDQKRGARMFFPTVQKAEHWRMRCNYARVLHRKENEKIHDMGEPLHGKSEYDEIMFVIKTSEDGFWVYAERQILDTSRVEPIPEEDSPALEATEIFQLEDHTNENSSN